MKPHRLGLRSLLKLLGEKKNLSRWDDTRKCIGFMGKNHTTKTTRYHFAMTNLTPNPHSTVKASSLGVGSDSGMS